MMKQLLSNNHHRRCCDYKLLKIYPILVLFFGNLIQQNHSFTSSFITSYYLPSKQHHNCFVVITDTSHGPSLCFPTTNRLLLREQQHKSLSLSLSLSSPSSVHDTSSSSSSGNKAASRWNQMFNLLMTYKQREKHCDVPYIHKEDGENLGMWLKNQRAAKKKETMNDERKYQLEDLGIAWELRSTPRSTRTTKTWNDMFVLLTQYKDREGNCNVPQLYTTEEGENLGAWLNTQREAKKKEKLNAKRKHQLEDLGVVWELKSTKSWEDMFILLTQYKDNNGHCNVPQVHKEDDENLGAWLHRQRQAKRIDKLNDERKRQLGDLGVVWELASTKSWEDMFILLTQYKDNNGHCNVPNIHKEDGENLGVWLNNQRAAKKKETMNNERKIQLEDLGIAWELRSTQRYARSTKTWDDMFLLLTQYKERNNGSCCNVPVAHIEDGENLGRWLSNQRQANKNGRLDIRRKHQLQDLGIERMEREDGRTIIHF